MLVSLPARVPQPALRRSFLPLATAVALFAVYLLTYSGQFHSIDENAVFAVSRNLVEHGRVDIGALFWGAPYFDQGRLGPDGELYSKYGLGHSLLLAPLVWLGLHLPGVGVVQTAVLLDGLATAATGALLVVLAGRLGFPRAGPWLAALYGLGTFAWVYARTLFGEPLSAL
ncbi:MAG TPA: hypothetical protein DEP84_35675, partial [Chloroflexi bacterium]|nr:hypothetical protein [Chloroflexota bacterium]